MTALSGAAADDILGYMANVTGNAGIYAERSSASRLYFPVTPGMRLVVRRVEEPWAAVLMQNGSVGWIKTQFIEVTPTVVRPAPAPAAPANALSVGETIAAEAMKYIGTRYVWGGNDLRNGIDCSGFVHEIFEQFGKNLPRTAALQAKAGQEITSGVLPGDRLLFCDSNYSRITHTGIYLGNRRFIHSAQSRGGVAVDDITDSRWRLIAIRRDFEPGTSAAPKN